MEDGFFSCPLQRTATIGSEPPLAAIDAAPEVISTAAQVLEEGIAAMTAPVLVVGHSRKRSQCPRSICRSQVSVDGHGPPLP